MSRELQEIKNLTSLVTQKFAEFERLFVTKNEFNTFKEGVYQQFETMGGYIESVREELLEEIRITRRESKNHLDMLLEQKQHEVSAVAEQYTSLSEKVEYNTLAIADNAAEIASFKNPHLAEEL